MDKTSIKSKKSLANEIYCSLKEDIVWVRLKPGDMLTEPYLAEIFKTSKTPVREALKRLSAENFITVLPHKGYMVANIPYNDMRDLFHCRIIIECAAIEYAARFAIEEQLTHLESLADNIKTTDKEKPHTPYSDFFDFNFHIYLVQMTGNRFLLETYVKIFEQLQRFIWYSTTESTRESDNIQHHQLVNLIRENKVSKAQSLIKKHINEIYEAGTGKKIPGI